MTTTVSFIKFPTCIDSQREWIMNKAKERLKEIPICVDALQKFSLKKDFKELIDIVDDIVMDSTYYNDGIG